MAFGNYVTCPTKNINHILYCAQCLVILGKIYKNATLIQPLILNQVNKNNKNIILNCPWKKALGSDHYMVSIKNNLLLVRAQLCSWPRALH